MATGHHQPEAPKSRRVGEHWSGANPIPTIGHFMKHLDEDKRERHAQEKRIKEEKAAHDQAEGTSGDQTDHQEEDPFAHKARKVSQARVRTVTDPTTGKEISVEDLDDSCMDAVNNPTV